MFCIAQFCWEAKLSNFLFLILAPIWAAIFTVPSELPESSTTTSSLHATDLRHAAMFFSSSKVSIRIEIIFVHFPEVIEAVVRTSQKIYTKERCHIVTKCYN